MSKHNWEKLETRYVSGTESLREISTACNIGYNTISRQSSRRGWAKKRVRYRAELVSQKTGRKLKAAVLSKAQFDAHCETVCDIVAKNSAAALKRKRKGKPLSAADKGVYLGLIKESQTIKYRAMGVPPPAAKSVVDQQAAYEAYLKRLAECEAETREKIKTGEIKVIKRYKKGKDSPQDMIEITITPPAGAQLFDKDGKPK